MDTTPSKSRRVFLKAALGSGVLLPGCGELSGNGKGEKPAVGKDKEPDVAPPEDLMREHGVLKRVLLVYGEAIQRLDANSDLSPDALSNAAAIVRSFIEDYHEKLEEDHLFPRFRQANKLVDLVDVLTQQHQAGRKLTDTTLRLANLQSMKGADDRHALAESLRKFIRMYSPHEAREDTVLFPALRKIVSAHEFDSLGEDFEKKEHELFGEDGFEKMVDRVAGIEKALGIYDLSQFTPRE